MAIRNIRMMGDKVLEKTCRPVETVTPRIRQLVGDMLETMYDACGVGLAAPQVGILKRIVVIDTDGEHPHILINPGKTGTVTRPNYVKVRAMDLDMQSFELEATELLARAVCHECDHLDGIMYTQHVEGPLRDVAYQEEEEEE